MGKDFFARRKMSFVLLSRDCRQAPAQVRLLRRSSRTHQVPLRVQQAYEVTILMIKHREAEAILQNQKNTDKKKGNNQATSSRLRDFQSGQRSSQMISKMKERKHQGTNSPTLLRTQTRNVLRKWHPRSKVFILTSLRPKLRSSQANQDYEGSSQEANWRSSTSGRKIR